MNLAISLKKSLVNSPVVAATAYAGVVIVLLALAASTVIDLLGRRASVASTAAMLEQLEGRKPAATKRISATPGDIAKGLPIVVLINGGTAREAERCQGRWLDHALFALLSTDALPPA